LSNYQKAVYPQWAINDAEKRKFLVLDLALQIDGESHVSGAARVLSISPQMLRHNLENGFSPRTAVYLESVSKNRYTRFDFNPELLKFPQAIKDYDALYSQTA
jgi:hypothetical protein